ncbi:MAG: 8-amino-7-oxononanoate synthase [Pseudomonadota bacterium]
MDETAERSTHEAYFRALEALSRRGRLRRLAPRSGLDFASNDYLGLAQSAELAAAARAAIERGVPVGAGGSRLLRGNHPEHETLEAEARAYFGAAAALFLGGGFLANYAIFSTLPQRGDLVVYDALIHASVHDGVRAGRAEAVAARHNDAESFEEAIRAWRAKGATGRAWLAVESLYSMDGDRAPLDDLAQVAERHDAMLVIDEAHATGVLGPDGRGLGAALEGRENVVALHTCGKGLGVAGALVTLPNVLADFLVNRCRPFIYATAPSPLNAALVRAALAIVRDQPERRQRLARRVEVVGAALRACTGLSPSGSHILPIVVGSDARAVALAEAIQAQGFDVRAIRPPTVPEGTARLRLALTLNVEEVDALRLVDVLADELSRWAP